MTLQGGPAAIHGFLYQVLRTAEWALRIDLSAPSRDLSQVMLIAEPRGGDLQIRFSSELLVQQFKTREGRTWSLTDIVEEVLPDLYRAVPDASSNVRYELVTNGRMGEWGDALLFFRALAERPTGQLGSLDVTAERFRLHGSLYSERSLFEEVVRSLRQRRPVQGEPEETTRRKLWHLLARFDFIAAGDAVQSEKAVRRLLSSYVLDDDLLDDKVARLVKTILDYSTQGNRPFTPEELLTDAGIEGISFTQLPLVRASVRELAAADMRRLLQYEPSLSVRAPMKWPEGGARIAVFSGESGQGKSWALADIAHDLLEREHRMFVVFARATGDFANDLKLAAERILRYALGHNTTTSFEQFATRVRRDLPHLHDPWLTVCLDDVQSSRELLAITEAPLLEWGIQIAMTVSPRRSDHSALARHGATIIKVPDFTDLELREFLLRRGREWGTIPADVRRTMRRPLLADLFVRLASTWLPKNEYELYDACWRRLSSDGVQPDHPGDLATLLALAAEVRDGGRYPWTPLTLRKLSVTGDEQTRLEAIGWLTREPNGHVRIWHDRLLNWAVAETIADDIPQLDNDAARIAAVIKPYLTDTFADNDHPRLAYVPMDVLWMVAHRNLLPAAGLAEVVEHLESSRYNETERLYRLLGSIGPEIVPTLVARLHRAAGKDDEHTIEMLVRQTVLHALRAAGDDAETHVSALIHDAAQNVREIGVSAAAEHPAAAHVPRLWALLLEHDREPTEDLSPAQQYRAAHRHWHRERLTSALSASVMYARQWLEEQILAAESNDPHLTTLAWMLSSLTDADGCALWLRVKASLFEKTPRAKPGGLINCIRNFRDTSEVRHLEEWIDCDHDFAAPSALGALAVVAPERAIEFVRSGVRGGTRGFASWWFPWLMLVRRDETLELARERLSSDDAVPEWFSHSEEYLDAATTRAISERLTAQLAEALERPQPEGKRVPFAPAARLLAAAAHVTTVDVLASYADSVFERQLVEMAGRLPFSDGHYLSDEGADIRTILRRVSETGSVAAIVEELMAEHKVAVRAIDWAAAYPVEPIREALRARLSRIAATWNGKEIPYRVIRLIRSLALVGDDGAVVDAISTFSANAVDDDLPWLLGDQPPLSDALVEKLLATATLSSSPDEQCRSLGALRLSRRHDVVPTILAIAARTDVTSAVRWFALTAARDLVKFGAEVADFVGSLVASDPGDERHILADLLIRSGTAASMDLLATLARRLPFTHVSDHAVVERLVDRSPRGKEMAELLASHLPPFPHTTLFNRDAFIWSRLIAALDRADLRQQALDYAGMPVAMVNPLSIIECVATFDGDAAFDFAHAALRSDVEGREVLPPHLLRYNARRAVDSLLRHLPEERSGVVRWHVARTLRWSGDPSIAARAEEMSRERSPEMRAAACDLAGWIPHVVGNDRLRELALADENKDVRTAARDALERQLRLTQSEKLRDRLRRSGGSKAWMYAEALVSYADPYLLDRREDPLFIYSALEQKPRALRLMVEQWLEPRLKQVDRDAESEDLVRGRRSV